VVDRLRALLQDPHDPAVARAVVLLACAATLGLAVVVGLGGAAGSDVRSGPARTPAPRATAEVARPVTHRVGRSAARRRPEPRQDPQDRPGSPPARRADRELSTHRALQHVPYRHDGITITLVGADGPRAVLRVESADRADAHRGWRRFLRRYRDDGRAYLPIFRAGGRHGR
jgi:hypothetical protein